MRPSTFSSSSSLSLAFSALSAYQAVKFYKYSIKKKDNLEPCKPIFTEDAIVEESAEIDDYLLKKNATHSKDSGDSFPDESLSENNVTTIAPPKVYDPEEPPELPPPLPVKSKTHSYKPPVAPKPHSISIAKPPRNLPSSKLKESNNLHKGMENLTDIGDNEVNDNNIDHTTNKTIHSTIDAKNDLSTLEDNENLSNNNTFIVKDTKDKESDETFLRTKEAKRVTKTDEEVYAELKVICNLSDPLDKYKQAKEVGKGASGVVFIASQLGTDKQVAIKTIDLKNQSSKELILNEIRVLQDFNHRNLVNFLEAYYLEKEDHLWVVLEYMNG
jgi:p21-activated kinase 1